jgi:agmatinase
VKNYGPVPGDACARFAGRPTFLCLPHTTQPRGADVAILGVPFDAHPSWRTGARFGPGAIRQASMTIRPFYSPSQRIAPFDHVSVIDRGDTQVESGFMDRTFDHVQAAVAELLAEDVVPICLGGDHVVTLAALRAVARKHGPVALVQFDAHIGSSEEIDGERHGHGTLVRRAVDEGLIDPKRSFLLGSRGGALGPEEAPGARELGLTVVSWDDLAQLGTGMISAAVEAAAGPAYLSYDVDFLDPAFAPGVSEPEVGGPTSMQALALLRACRGLQVVGADVTSVAPEHDGAGITAALAATLAFEIITLIACERQARGENA